VPDPIAEYKLVTKTKVPYLKMYEDAQNNGAASDKWYYPMCVLWFLFLLWAIFAAFALLVNGNNQSSPPSGAVLVGFGVYTFFVWGYKMQRADWLEKMDRAEAALGPLRAKQQELSKSIPPDILKTISD